MGGYVLRAEVNEKERGLEPHYGICDLITFNENSIHTGIPALYLTNSSVLKVQKIRIFSYCEINILHTVLVINKGQVLRKRSIQTLLLQSCTWRISLACSGRQCDSGDRVTRNGERREKAEERKMIGELLSPPPPPRPFSYILFFALFPLSWNRQALLVSGDQITSNRRSINAHDLVTFCALHSF